MFLEYRRQLAEASLADETVRTYRSRIRQYLSFLDQAGERAALTSEAARDRAVARYIAQLTRPPQSRSAAYVNSLLSAINDFSARLGLAPTTVNRVDAPVFQSRMRPEEVDGWIATTATMSAHGALVCLLPLLAGLRISQVTRLDLAAVEPAERRIVVDERAIALDSRLVPVLEKWLAVRPSWPRADEEPALLLNTRGRRLSVRSASSIIREASTATRESVPGREITAELLRREYRAVGRGAYGQ